MKKIIIINIVITLVISIGLSSFMLCRGLIEGYKIGYRRTWTIGYMEGRWDKQTKRYHLPIEIEWERMLEKALYDFKPEKKTTYGGR